MSTEDQYLYADSDVSRVDSVYPLTTSAEVMAKELTAELRGKVSAAAGLVHQDLSGPKVSPYFSGPGPEEFDGLGLA